MAIFLVYSTSGITSDKKSLFMMMTSSMTSQGNLKVGLLYKTCTIIYSSINEITTFFKITRKRAKISSLNFLCVSIMRLWLHLYRYIYMYIHDVIVDVTRSQSRSNFENDISPLIFELERRSKAQNNGNANGYLSGIFNFRSQFR